jgi:hypothetical protein
VEDVLSDLLPASGLTRVGKGPFPHQGGKSGWAGRGTLISPPPELSSVKGEGKFCMANMAKYPPLSAPCGRGYRWRVSLGLSSYSNPPLREGEVGITPPGQMKRRTLLILPRQGGGSSWVERSPKGVRHSARVRRLGL